MSSDIEPVDRENGHAVKHLLASFCLIVLPVSLELFLTNGTLVRSFIRCFSCWHSADARSTLPGHGGRSGHDETGLASGSRDKTTNSNADIRKLQVRLYVLTSGALSRLCMQSVS